MGPLKGWRLRSPKAHVVKLHSPLVLPKQHQKYEERGKGPMDDSQEVDNLLRDLEVARRERDEARIELQKLKSTLQMVDDTPCSTKALSWLGWVHKLRDKETIVSKAKQGMKKSARGRAGR